MPEMMPNPGSDAVTDPATGSPGVSALQASSGPDPAPVPEAPLLHEPEPSPMIDVHPPHQSVHTWKDFFIHMTTIVLGLLIAIGLEQSVEAVHHSRQRRDLRESLERESRQILKDSIETEAAEKIYLVFDEGRVAQLRDAAWKPGPFPPRPPNPRATPFYFPDDPIWRSAKTSGLVDLLTQPEINAFSEIELLIGGVRVANVETNNLVRKQRSFEDQLPRLKGSSEPDFSALSQEDRRQYLTLFSDLTTATRGYRGSVIGIRGAEEAILRGERNLNAIFKAERTYRSDKPE